MLARRPGVDLRDSGLAMASACEAVAAAPSRQEAHGRIVRAALGLVRKLVPDATVRWSGGEYEAAIPLMRAS